MPKITLEKMAFYEKELINDVKIYLKLILHIFLDDKLSREYSELLQHACERLSSFDGITSNNFEVFDVINKLIHNLEKTTSIFFIELIKKENEIKSKAMVFRPDGTHCMSVLDILTKNPK